ncbi:MAG: glycosyltransferase family 39 protein [Bacteroidetes bacterium]|nr:glycosyltransferase family 39 protein [Bacteroidota bacterium]
MKMIKSPYFIITILSSILFVPFLGSVHLFDWDEINFAEAAREMIITGNYKNITINFEPFWEKPPLFIWFQVICMKIFGINEFAARLPNAVCGIVTFNLIYFIGKKLFNQKLAIWWILLYAGSFTPHFYFKSGIIDPWYNLFIFLSIFQLFEASENEKKRRLNFMFCGIFLGLALLTKGPVAILISGLCGFVFLISNKFKMYFDIKDLLILLLFTAILPLFWFLPDWLKGDFWFTSEFLKYQIELFQKPVASHGQPWFYHPLVLVLGCFPAIIISMPYLLRRKENISFLTWMQILFWVTLVIFSIVTTKIVHYSSLCYLPATFIGAYFLSKNIKFYLWQNFLILLVGLFYSVAFAFVFFIGFSTTFKEKIISLINDEFVVQNILAPTQWKGYEIAFAFIFLIITLGGFATNLKKPNNKAIKIWLISQTVFIFLILIFMLPKIENHVQGSIISFYKTLKGRDVYVETIGFKSYAHYFYTARHKPANDDYLQNEIKRYCIRNNWDKTIKLNENIRNKINGFKQTLLFSQTVNKPVYFVCKIGNNEYLDTAKQFKLVFNQGGYRVYEKK